MAAPSLAPLRQRGFTLFEILVVIIIIGLTALIIIPRIGSGDSKQRVRDEAERLSILVGAVRQEAILKFNNYVLQIYPNQYQFQVIDPTAGPQPIDANLFRPRNLPDDMYFKVSADNKFNTLSQFQPEEDESEQLDTGGEEEDEAPKPDLNVLILASGELTPFSVKLISESGAEYDILGELTGKITIADPSEI